MNPRYLRVNPDNDAFKKINDNDFINKTSIAKMLSKYYDRSCKSHTLFRDKKLTSTKAYAKHQNKFNVICPGVSSFSFDARKHHLSYQAVSEIIKKALKSCFGLLKTNR